MRAEGASRKASGVCLLAGAGQWFLAATMAEAVNPSYSVGRQPISDLGVGQTALFWNTSTFLLGALVVLGAVFAYRIIRPKWAVWALALMGFGTLLVGIFPEDSALPVMHILGAFTAFIFGGVAAIAMFWFAESPFRYFSIALGVSSLIALGLFSTGAYVNLGLGGMERMIVAPTSIWLAAFGGYLMGAAKAGAPA